MDYQAHDILPFSQTSYVAPTAADEVLPILREKNLPDEIALEIASLGYSPGLSKRRVRQQVYHVSNYGTPTNQANITGLYLSTNRMPENGWRVGPQRIIFQTRAKDQGWADAGGDGTFENSHTWFEASILRSFPLGTEGNDRDVTLEDDLSISWQTAVTMGKGSHLMRRDDRI